MSSSPPTSSHAHFIRAIVLSLVAAVALLCGPLVATPAQAADQTTISGTVTDEDGAPIGNVNVAFYASDDDWASYGYTDQDGRYTVALDPGTYRLAFNDYSGRYRSEFYSNKTSLVDATPVPLNAASDVTGIDAQLTARPMLTGALTGTSGKAAPYVSVEAYTYDAQTGEQSLVAGATADNSGHYALPLDPGSYRLRFLDYQHTYVTEYYDNVVNIASATPVTMGSVDTAGPDVQLARNPAISGTLTGAGGKLLSNGYVTAYQYDAEFKQWNYVKSMSTDTNGAYSLAAEPGNYRLEFADYSGEHISAFYQDAATVEAATSVVLPAQSVAGINMQLKRKPGISGTVKGINSAKLPYVQVTAYSKPDGSDTWTYASSTSTDDDGGYFLAVGEGTYRLKFEQFSTSYATEFYNNASTVEGATSITVGTTGQTGIDVQLAPKPHLSGTVSGPGGAVLKNIDVIAHRYDANAKAWLRESSATSASDGTYDLELDPGSYRLQFRDDSHVYGTEYYLDKSTLDSATPVELGGQDKTGVDARLAANPRITGTVTGPGGKLLSGIDVAAYSFDDDENVWNPVSDVVTRADGTYALPLDPGTYRLEFADDTDKAKPYASEFYLDTSTVEGATSVVLGSTDKTGINALLAPMQHISGTVTSATGTPIGGILVSSYAQGTDGWSSKTSARTNSAGTYSIAVNPNTTYHLKFSDRSDTYRTEYYDNVTTDIDDGTDVVVAAADVTGQDAALARNPIVYGTVKDSSGEGIEHADVTAYAVGADDDGIRTVQTDVEGRYRLPLPTGGTYKIGFDGPSDYVDEYYDDASTLAAATPLTVTDDRTGTNAVLAKRPAITGTVTGPSGPAAGTSVTAYAFYAFDQDNPADGYWEYQRETTTAANGSYSLRLAPGTYHLRFGNQGGLRGEVYDNVQGDIADGKDVVLSSGGGSTANAQLSAGASISGTVTGPSNVPLSEAEVIAYQLDNGTYGAVTDAFTDADGRYVIAVDPGTYKLAFRSSGYQREFYADKSTLDAAVPIVVDAPVAGKDASLAPASAITGTVTATTGGSPLRGIEVEASRLDESSGRWEGIVSDDVTDTAGAYRLPVGPGTYRVGFSDPQGTFRAEYIDNKSTFAGATSVVVGGSDLVRNVDLAVNPTITGKVTGPNGSALGGVAVTALQLDDVDDDWYDAQQVTTAADGTYKLPVATGTYRLRFDGDDGQYKTEYYDNADTVSAATDQVVTGAGLSGRDARLAANLSIKGSVTGPGGGPAAGVLVRAYEAFDDGGDTYWDEVSQTKTAADGTYSVPVADGTTYRLGFSTDDASLATEYYNDKATVQQAEDIKIDGSDVSGKDAALVGGSGISGTVTVPGSDGYGIVTAYLYDPADGGSWSVYDTQSTGGTSDSYVMPAAPGTYRIKFRATADDEEGGAIFNDVYWKGASTFSAATNVVVTAGTVVPSIDMVFGVGQSVTNSVAPTVGGTAIVGGTLTASEGTWGPGGTSPVGFTYQWFRDGEPVQGARSKTYLLTADDVGSTFAVRVTGSKSGLFSLSKTSASTAKVKPAVVVPPVVTPPVVNLPVVNPPYVPPTVSVRSPAKVVVTAKSKKGKVTLTITVKASGERPTGKVVVKMGRKTLKTVRLSSGKIKVVLPKQKKGKRAYTIAYGGDAKVLPASTIKKVTVR